MENEIKQSIYMGVELMFTSAVLGLIVTVILIGHIFVNNIYIQKSSANLIQDETIFYTYMNNQGTITQSDVINLIQEYGKVYDFVIMDGNQIKAKYTTSDDEEKWYYKSIYNDLKAYNKDMFTMQQILSSDGYAIQAVVFTKGSTKQTSDRLREVADEVGIHTDISSK